MKQGEVLFASNNQLLRSAYEWLVTCWHLLRSNEIDLIVQNYRRIGSKNKRHKQVCHCLSNTYKLLVNSVNWESKFWTPLFPLLACHSIDCPSLSRHSTFKALLFLIILPRLETVAHQLHPHAPFSLRKSTDLVRTNRLHPKPFLFTWHFPAKLAPSPACLHKEGPRNSKCVGPQQFSTDFRCSVLRCQVLGSKTLLPWPCHSSLFNSWSVWAWVQSD